MIRSILLLLLMTLLTGILYPLLITGIAALTFKEKANGSLVTQNLVRVGSSLIAQKFHTQPYFWPRPSATAFNTLPSGGSNLAPTSSLLAKEVRERREFWAGTHGKTIDDPIPQDLLFASASGLDPHISQAAAYFQLPRVAAARGLSEEEVHIVQGIIDSLVEHNPRVFPGETGVNVLLLNLAIDRAVP